MIDILSDPVSIIVVGLAALLLLWPIIRKALSPLGGFFKADPMSQIKKLKSLKRNTIPEAGPKIDELCRMIFEESLK